MQTLVSYRTHVVAIHSTHHRRLQNQ